jgi:hypothetical protein
MTLTPNPRAARYTQSHGVAVPEGEPAPVIVPESSAFYDHAKAILTPAPIMQDQRADAWDHYHLAKTPRELSTRLQGLGLPPDVQQQLLDAKQSSRPEPTPLDRAVEAVKRLASIPQATLDVAERSPNVLKALLAGSDEA